MKSAVKKITSIFAAALIMPLSLAGLFPVKVSAEEEVAKTAETAVTTEDNTITSYMEKYKDVPNATDDVELALQGAALSDGSEIKEVEGRNGLVLPETGTASWTIQVPKTALYVIKLDYCPMPADGQTIEVGFTVDGKKPYEGSGNVEFKRIWKDAGEIIKDFKGNDLPPKQKEVIEWKSTYFNDYSSYYNGEYTVYLEAGQHTFGLKCENESIALSNLKLTGKEKLPTYAEVSKDYERNGYKSAEKVLKFQAEAAYEKSDSSLVPTYDRGTANTESIDESLNSASQIRRNTFGQEDWSKPGMWVSYKVDVPEDGLYKMAMKTRQNFQTGMSVMRDIYIDGKIPFAEMKSVLFPYSQKWETVTVSDESGSPCFVYLKKGTHEIRFVASISRWSDVLTKLEKNNKELNQLYRKIIKVTGALPDPNRDYQLENQITGMIDTMKNSSDVLYSLADEFTKLNNNDSSQTSFLKNCAKQLSGFVKDPDTIPKRFADFQSNIGMLSLWLLGAKEQPLEMDYLMLAGENEKLPKAMPSFWQSLKFNFDSFIASFTVDYNSLTDVGESKDSIRVWFTGNRDQATIIRDMIQDNFTPKTNIEVNLEQVYQGYIEATLAGKGPDVALQFNRGVPVNLASRGALLDISHFKTYENVMSRFSKGAEIPYTYNGGVYAVPDMQFFFMMFYRSDILKELGVKPPETWDELNAMIPLLERNHYVVGLPYLSITALGADTQGIGQKDIFTTLLLQNGGKLYNEDCSRSALDSIEAVNSFKQWTDYYTKYSFPTEANLNTWMRQGRMPIAIARFDMYNTLYVGAPEIRGLWDIAPIPGTKKSDGTIDRSVGGAGTANVIYKNTKNPEGCWKFMDWWTSEESQYQYGMTIENRLGPAARFATANIKAFDRLPWSRDNVKKLEEQRQSLVEIPEVPGSYMVTRCIDNAFRSVTFNGKNERERFKQEVDNINDEIKRKRIEFGLE